MHDEAKHDFEKMRDFAQNSKIGSIFLKTQKLGPFLGFWGPKSLPRFF